MSLDAFCRFLGRASSNLLEPPTFKRLDRRFGLEIENVFHGISYYELNKADATAALEVLPSGLRPHFRAWWMEISGDIPPHVDNVIRCAINIYVESRGGDYVLLEAKRGESKNLETEQPE